MCGIIGGVGSGTQQEIDLLIHEISHRGPDAQGKLSFKKSDTNLGHVRLAIIDLDERSSQPMSSNCGNYHLVFNGEIYNYQKLRTELQHQGYRFRTESDTEVLLYWLIERGAEGINELDGMFAFCFFDAHSEKLLLARDHIGEKPLYYAMADGRFYFCSEIGPLSKLKGIDRRLNLEALKNYLFFLYTAPPQTLYEAIKELGPGQYMTVNLSDLSLDIQTYFSLIDHLPIEPESNSAERDVAIFSERFTNAVISRLVADVPVGMYLSGGLDSNAIVAEARRACGADFCTFTMSYANDREAKEYDESRIAAECARFYGISNQCVDLDEMENFMAAVEKTVDMFGQPFGNATCLVAEKLSATVSKSHKVCLVGDGGDELLAGYPRYKALKLYRWARFIPKFFISLVLRLVDYLPETGKGATKIRRFRQFLEGCRLPLPKAYLQWVGYKSFDEINKALSSSGNTNFYNDLVDTFQRFQEDPVRAAGIVDFLSFVPFNLMQASDRTSMANSLELRCPFVAKDLVLSMLGISSTNKFSDRYNKRLLVEALSDILPKHILDQPKRPFNPPMRSFISDNMSLVRGFICHAEQSLLPKLLSKEFVDNEVSVFEAGDRDNSVYLWGLVTLEYWLRKNYESEVVAV